MDIERKRESVAQQRTSVCGEGGEYIKERRQSRQMEIKKKEKRKKEGLCHDDSE